MNKRLGLLLCCLLLAGTAPVHAEAQTVDIHMFISGPEYADAIRTLIDAYKTVAPQVTLHYETTQSDYPALLKTRLNAGDCPDIFATTSGKEIGLYREYSADLTDTPAAEALLAPVRAVMSDGGRVYGFHFVCNDFGIVYNQTVLKNCGIQTPPQTLTELESACAALQAHGYQPITTGFGEWWVYKHIFQHFFNAATDDPAALAARFAAGQAKMADYPALYESFFRFLDLAVRYGDAKPLETGLADEVTALASGKAGMMLGQGAWVEGDLLNTNPAMHIGFDGYPVSENAAQCQVVFGPDQALRVYRDSPVLAETLAFVNWWMTSDYASAWISDTCRVIPATEGARVPGTAIATQGAVRIAQKGAGTLSISFSTDGFHQAFGRVLQAYVGGLIDRDVACTRIEHAWMDADGAQ